MTPLEKTAWELYREETEGLMCSANSWVELSITDRERYLEKAEAILYNSDPRVADEQEEVLGHCVGRFQHMGLFDEGCDASTCKGYWGIGDSYARVCGYCRYWRKCRW